VGSQGTIAVVQTGSVLGKVEQNLANLHRWLGAAADSGCALVAFPECTLSGYVFDSRAEVEAAAISVDGREIARIGDWCAQLEIVAVFGFLERAGDRIFNTAAVVGPKGVIGKHRKRHLPFIGADRFVGRSQIVDPRGCVRAHAHQMDGLITADLNIALARDKRIVFRKGEFEISPWLDRRPNTYRL
jgi:predicted amidohydrolase